MYVHLNSVAHLPMCLTFGIKAHINNWRLILLPFLIVKMYNVAMVELGRIRSSCIPSEHMS